MTTFCWKIFTARFQLSMIKLFYKLLNFFSNKPKNLKKKSKKICCFLWNISFRERNLCLITTAFSSRLIMQVFVLVVLRKNSRSHFLQMFITLSLNLLHSVENIGLLSQSRVNFSILCTVKGKSIKLIELGKFAVMSYRVMIVEAMSISSPTDIECIANLPIAG